VDYVTTMMHKAMDESAKRGKLATEDLVYLVRKARISERFQKTVLFSQAFSAKRGQLATEDLVCLVREARPLLLLWYLDISAADNRVDLGKKTATKERGTALQMRRKRFRHIANVRSCASATSSQVGAGAQQSLMLVQILRYGKFDL